MKKLFVSLFIAVLILPAVNAQFTKIGGGVGYGTGYWFHNMDIYDYNRSGHFPVFLEGIYEITVPLHVTGRISYFFPNVTKEFETKYTVSSMMVDINGHYVFNSLDKLEFYGLAGMNFLYTWKKTRFLSSDYVEPESDNAFGLNLGVGACFKLTNQFDIFAEAKYILATNHYSQFMANAGILINIDWMKKHENDPN